MQPKKLKVIDKGNMNYTSKMPPLFAPPLMVKTSLGILSSIKKNFVQFHTKLVLLVSRRVLPDLDPDRRKKKKVRD